MKRRLTAVSFVPLSFFLWWLSLSGTATARTATTKPRGLFGFPTIHRGGAFSEDGTSANDNSNNNNNATVEEYVAAMKEKDGQQDHRGEEDYAPVSSRSESSSYSTPDRGSNNEEEPAVVGVKSHHKKSNAVGDPDGDESDSDSDSLSEYSEEWEELEEFDSSTFEVDQPSQEQQLEQRVQFEVEVVEEESADEDDTDKHATTAKKSGGGGVGVRLGRINNRRRNRKGAWRSKTSSSSSSTARPSQENARILEAWMPHIYFPPTSGALEYLADNARLLDASSKNRLDRRTLYAGLLLEWGSTSTKLSFRTRRYLSASASQVLQAALSMATQPQWRQSSPRTSGIRLYQDDETTKASTLGMQETISMALVRKS
jgi:hypothetical protein